MLQNFSFNFLFYKKEDFPESFFKIFDFKLWSFHVSFPCFALKERCWLLILCYCFRSIFLNGNLQGTDNYFIRSTHQNCSVKKGVLKSFAIFTGKHLCWSLFLNIVAGLQVFWWSLPISCLHCKLLFISANVSSIALIKFVCIWSRTIISKFVENLNSCFRKLTGLFLLKLVKFYLHFDVFTERVTCFPWRKVILGRTEKYCDEETHVFLLFSRFHFIEFIF